MSERVVQQDQVSALSCQADRQSGGRPRLVISEIFRRLSLSYLLLTTLTMPGLGPSLVFAAGLAIGVGAGTFLPPRPKKDAGVLPPPPVEKYDVVKKIPTAGGSAMLQGGFPGMPLPPAT